MVLLIYSRSGLHGVPLSTEYISIVTTVRVRLSSTYRVKLGNHSEQSALFVS